jgi:uncharacterized YccA/Bax inhibitor family protein
MFKSSNPMFRDDAYRQVGTGELMTASGTVNKAFILGVILVLGASMVWSQPLKYMPLAIPASIIGFVLYLVTFFKKEWSPITAPAYALCQGFAIGWISAMFEQSYHGIAVQAVILTFGVLFCMLGLYQSRIIKVNDKFRMVVACGVGAICLVYLVSWIMSFFGSAIPLINGGGVIGIGFSLIVVVFAAMCLAVDFDFIERGSQSGMPKYMEWYAAFGLMVTLIWLYLEILKLLSKFARRD